MENEIVKAEVKELALTEQQRTATIGRITKALSGIEKGYLTIVGDVAKLKDAKAYECTGSANIYDMTAELFGMSRGTTSNLLTMAKRFCVNYKLSPEWEKYNFSQLREIMKLTDEQFAISGIIPEMTRREVMETVDKLIDASKAITEKPAKEEQVSSSESEAQEDEEEVTITEHSGINDGESITFTIKKDFDENTVLAMLAEAIDDCSAVKVIFNIV